MEKSVGFIWITSHVRDDVPKRTFKPHSDIREYVRCHAQIVRRLIKAVMAQVGLQDREHSQQVLALFRPGFKPVDCKGMADMPSSAYPPLCRVPDYAESMI